VEERNKEPRLSLAVALRRYWRYLLGIVLFPPLAFSAVELLHVPFPLLIVPFFAVTFLAMWPWFAKRAPYSFWLVAMGLWTAAGFVGILVLQFLRLIFHLPVT